MGRKDSLPSELDGILREWLHALSFPEEIDPASGEPWSPEIQAVIAEAQRSRRAERQDDEPLGTFVADVLREALLRHLDEVARYWTDRERPSQWLAALLILEQYLVPVDRNRPREEVFKYLGDEAYLREAWNLDAGTAREVQREVEEVSDTTRYRRRWDGIGLQAEAVRSWAGAGRGRRVPRRRAGLQPLPPIYPVAAPRELPPLPDIFVRRESEERAITDKLLHERTRTLILWGSGGMGKSTLAIWVAQSLVDRFPDGIIWVEHQPDGEVSDMQSKIARSFGVVLKGRSPAERAGELRTLLYDRQCLLVLDGVWATSDLVHLRVVNEASRLLVTTRDAKVTDILSAPLVRVSRLTEAEGLTLLAAWAEADLETAAARELVVRLGGLPLALRLSGATLRAGDRLPDVLNIFRQKQVDLSKLDLDDPETAAESLNVCFDLSYDRLTSIVQGRFARLGCFIGIFDEAAAAGVWGVDSDGARRTLRRLWRLALLEREVRGYRLHPLLRDYTRQKLTAQPDEDQTAHRRHAAWHIRYVLYHPGMLAGITDPVPDLERAWADVVAGVKWAASQEPRLAAWAALLAHADRPALLEAVGPALVDAVTTHLSEVSDPAAQAIFHELLGDLHLLHGDIEAGVTHFSQAGELWEAGREWLAGSRAKLRVAGGYLLLQDAGAAAAAARQAQSSLAKGLPLAPEDREAAYRLFYWFDVIYNPLVRWEGLPEADVADLARLAEQTRQPVLEARGLHIYRLWCTAKGMPRSAEAREQGRALAIKAYWLWKACARLDRADDEISFSGHLLNGRYSQRAAARYARRRSRTTPMVNPDQIQLVRSKGMRWWLGASEAQRVDWLSRMLPRYLDATNCPAPALMPSSRAWRWVEDILSVGVLGSESRRLATNDQPPAGHFLNGPEWQALSGRRPHPWAEPAAARLIQGYAVALAHEMIEERVA